MDLDPGSFRDTLSQSLAPEKPFVQGALAVEVDAEDIEPRLGAADEEVPRQGALPSAPFRRRQEHYPPARPPYGRSTLPHDGSPDRHPLGLIIAAAAGRGKFCMQNPMHSRN